MATRQVVMPTPQKSPFGTLGTIAGGVIGGIYGGPAGAKAGMTAGGAIGGVLENIDKQPQVQSVQSGQGPMVPEKGGGLAETIGIGAQAYQGVQGIQDIKASVPQDVSGGGSVTPTMSENVMERRLNKINDDPLVALNKARKALEYQPKDIREQYEPIINQALINTKRQKSYSDYGSIG